MRRPRGILHGGDPRPVSPIIRVLFALPRGATWERTWQVGESRGGRGRRAAVGRCPSGCWRCPWTSSWRGRTGLSRRMRPLAQPAQPGLAGGVSPRAREAVALAQPRPGRPTKSLVKLRPPPLARYSPAESRLVLPACGRSLGVGRACGADRLPRSGVLQLMTMIYLASHQPAAPCWSRAGLPCASWFLLREYLQDAPAAAQALSAELSRGGGGRPGTPPRSSTRMQKSLDDVSWPTTASVSAMMGRCSPAPSRRS